MKGKTHGFPTAGPEIVTHPLAPADGAIEEGKAGKGVVVEELVVVDGDVVVEDARSITLGTSFISTACSSTAAILFVESDSVEHLERPPRIQSPHLTHKFQKELIN